MTINEMPLWRKVSNIDSYFQNHENKFLSKQGERIADQYYENNGEGWEKVSEKNLKMAYNEYQNLLMSNDIDENEAINF